jgi:hypothetical protein
VVCGQSSWLISYMLCRGFHGSDYESWVCWDVAPCGFIINRRFGGTCRLHLQSRRNNVREKECLRLLAWVISSTLKMEVTLSSETSVYNKPTRGHIPEHGLLHSCIVQACNLSRAKRTPNRLDKGDESSWTISLQDKSCSTPPLPSPSPPLEAQFTTWQHNDALVT